MNKKTFLIIAFLVSGIVFSMLFYIIIFSIKEQNQKIELSEFTLIDTKGETQIISGTRKPMLIVFFKSDCPFCSDEVKAITDNIDKFTQATVLFISNETIQSIEHFEHNFNVSGVKFLQDKNSIMKRRLQIISYPTIFIISRDGKIIKKKSGFVSIEFIASILQNE